MKFNDFIGEVQHELELASEGEALRASRAVLQTLGERLGHGEAKDLASPLPMEIDRFPTATVDEHGQQFTWDEFIDRVAQRANVEEADAAYYAQAIIAIVHDLEPEGEFEEIKTQLPDDFEDLWELTEKHPA
ncbi:MAG: DUF2267 domain-containing protein [Halobacteriaceae archaeon]